MQLVLVLARPPPHAHVRPEPGRRLHRRGVTEQRVHHRAAGQDLGPVVRACLLARRWDASYLLFMVNACLPFPRAPARPVQPDAASAPPLLNILLGTLLGLYPRCVKLPPFPARVTLAARVHALLTAPPDDVVAFLRAHTPLLMLALSEYFCHVLPAFMPVEHAALCATAPAEHFFDAAPALYEAFRQERIDTGHEAWADLSAAAAGLHDRITRGYRAKCRVPPLQRRPAPTPAQASTAELADALHAALAAPVILRRPHTRGPDQALRAEYALLLGSRASADTAAFHGLVAVAQLPSNIHAMQLEALRAVAQRCQGQAALRRVLHLCLLCERRGRRSTPRLCSRTFRVVCQACDDRPDTIVRIDSLGRVLTVRGRQLVFAPCCARIREYTGTGSDLLSGACAHDDARLVGRPSQRPRCAVCDANALSRRHEHLDPETFHMAVVYLCQRHTPPEEWCRRVPNMRHFERVCADWARKVRASSKRG